MAVGENLFGEALPSQFWATLDVHKAQVHIPIWGIVVVCCNCLDWCLFVDLVLHPSYSSAQPRGRQKRTHKHQTAHTHRPDVLVAGQGSLHRRCAGRNGWWRHTSSYPWRLRSGGSAQRSEKAGRSQNGLRVWIWIHNHPPKNTHTQLLLDYQLRTRKWR